MVIETRIMANNKSIITLSTASLVKSEVLLAMVNFRLLALYFASKSFNSSCIWALISTPFAPLCFCIESPMAGAPLIWASFVLSLVPSTSSSNILNPYFAAIWHCPDNQITNFFNTFKLAPQA